MKSQKVINSQIQYAKIYTNNFFKKHFDCSPTSVILSKRTNKGGFRGPDFQLKVQTGMTKMSFQLTSLLANQKPAFVSIKLSSMGKLSGKNQSSTFHWLQKTIETILNG